MKPGLLCVVILILGLDASAQYNPMPAPRKVNPGIWLSQRKQPNNQNQRVAAKPPIETYATSHKKVVENTVYRLQNYFSYKYVEVEDALFSKGKKIQQWEADQGTALKDKYNQEWIFLQVAYDNEKGAVFEIINNGFTNFLMHNDNGEVMAGTVFEYGYSCHYKWYLKTMPNMGNSVEIRSYANGKRLRIASSNRDNGIGLVLDSDNSPTIDAGFRIEFVRMGGPDVRDLLRPVQFKSDYEDYYLCSFTDITPAASKTGNIAGQNDHVTFTIVPDSASYYFFLKSNTNRYLKFFPGNKTFGFAIGGDVTADCRFNIIALPRNTKRFFIVPANTGLPMQPGTYSMPGTYGNSLELNLGPMENLNKVIWQLL